MTIRSIGRAMRVLQELNKRPMTTIADLHACTKLPKPTLVRILQTLVADGFVENDKRIGGYQVTSMVSELSAGYHKDPMVVEAGRPWVVALTRKHKWPASIALPDRDAMIIRFSTTSDSSMSPFYQAVNMRLSMTTRALGLAYLAHLPQEQYQLIVSMIFNLKEPSEQASDKETLFRIVSDVRNKGYATRNPFVEPRNSNTIAVPVFNSENRVVASVGITFYSNAYSSESKACEILVPILKEASQAINSDLRRLEKTMQGT